jgi:large subunit ribosomal protein L31
MQKDIHPDYHEIKVIMTDGSEFTTKSTYGKAGDTLRLDIDPKTHPAWTGKSAFIKNVSKVAKFKDKYGDFSFSGSSKKEETKPEENK